MSKYYVGKGSSFQIGKEATFGTAVVPDTLVNFTAEAITTTVEKTAEENLLKSKTDVWRDLMGVTVSGNVSFTLKPEFAGLLFYLAMGAEDDVVNSGEHYEHTFKLCDSNVDLPSFTAVVDRQFACRQYPGMTVSQLSLSCPAQEYVTGTLDMQGTKDEDGTLAEIQAHTIPSYRCTAAQLTVGGTVYDASGADLTISNGLTDAPVVYSSGIYKGQPIKGTREVTLGIDIPASAEIETLRQQFLMTEEPVAALLTFGSSRTDYTIQISIPNLAITDVTANVSGTGILTASVTGVAISVGTVEALQVKVIDDRAEAY